MRERRTIAGVRTLTKILLSSASGAIAYILTQLVSTTTSVAFTVTTSLLVGGIVLITQFLVELERSVEQNVYATRELELRTDEIGRGFVRTNEATELFGLVEASALRSDSVVQLVRNTSRLDPGAAPIALDLAESEIARVSAFLRELTDGAEVTYDGEDRDWLLALARNARQSIDSTSLSTVDAGGRGWVDGGLWSSDLGQRYLEAQQDAIRRRGVTVRRIFILDRAEMRGDHDFLRIARTHREVGVTVRAIAPSEVPSVARTSLLDFVVFDGALSYETQPASRISQHSRPVIISTRLVTAPQRVRERMQRYEELWSQAEDVS